MTATIPPSPRATRLLEIARLFLKLGFTAFGGPAAHIALMHDEIVTRRRWLTDAEFLDLLGATNLIPGPNSTEMAIHVGYVRAGWIGLIVGGASFIVPAMLIVLALAWAYVTYGSTLAAGWLLYGVKPVIIAVVVQALWMLGRMAIKGWLAAALVSAVIVLYFLNVDNLLLLAAGGVIVMLAANAPKLRSANLLWIPLGVRHALPLQPLAIVLASEPFSLWTLFLIFLKIGAVLYGSGYVLLAFVHTDFVMRLGWLSERQLLDAIAVGQVTPGPLFTSATFIGYLLGGLPGALAATLGIFLPSFVFVAVSSPLIPRIRRSAWAGAFLDGVNVSALGLMAAVTIQLAQAAFVIDGRIDALAVALGLAAAIVLVKWKVNSIWLVLGGAAVGLLRLVVQL